MTEERSYGMKNCPIQVKKPEFKVEHSDPASNFGVEFGVGEYADKTSCESYIDLDADQGGAYEMQVAIKVGNKWYADDAVQAVRVKIRGSFERDGFKYALQKTGLMTLPFYGKIKGYWEEENAIQEQS